MASRGPVAARSGQGDDASAPVPAQSFFYSTHEDSASEDLELPDTVVVRVRSVAGMTVFGGSISNTTTALELLQKVGRTAGRQVPSLNLLCGTELIQRQQQVCTLLHPQELTLLVREPVKSEEKQRALRTAVYTGDVARVQELLDENVCLEVDPEGDQSMGLLHLACDRGTGAHSQIVELLIQAGVDVNRQTSATGKTPLHFAAHRLGVGPVLALLQAGADVEACDVHGSRPLLSAFETYHITAVSYIRPEDLRLEDRLAVVRAICLAGADPRDLVTLAWRSFTTAASHNIVEWLPLCDWACFAVIQELRRAGARRPTCCQLVMALEPQCTMCALLVQLAFFAQLGTLEWVIACSFVLLVSLFTFGRHLDLWRLGLREISWKGCAIVPFSGLVIASGLASTPRPAWPQPVPSSAQMWLGSWGVLVAGVVIVLCGASLCSKLRRLYGRESRLPKLIHLNGTVALLLLFCAAVLAARATWVIFALIGVPAVLSCLCALFF